jgi:hypothetical protein
MANPSTHSLPLPHQPHSLYLTPTLNQPDAGLPPLLSLPLSLFFLSHYSLSLQQARQGGSVAVRTRVVLALRAWRRARGGSSSRWPSLISSPDSDMVGQARGGPAHLISRRRPSLISSPGGGTVSRAHGGDGATCNGPDPALAAQIHLPYSSPRRIQLRPHRSTFPTVPHGGSSSGRVDPPSPPNLHLPTAEVMAHGWACRAHR